MTAPILIIAGLLAAAGLAIWQVRRPPWESGRLRRQVEREAQQLGVIEPGARKRALGRAGDRAMDGMLGEMMATAQGDWVVAASKLLEGFERGVFVRSTEYDAGSEWEIRALPYIQALGALKCLVDEAERATRGDR
jgi:hypothetical protein